MPDETPEPQDPIDHLIRRSRPSATPSGPVRVEHRALLDEAIVRASGPARPGWRASRQLAGAAAAAIVLGGAAVVVALDDGGGDQVVAGDVDPPAADGGAPGDGSDSSSPALVSAACGGRPLPFTVPVDPDHGPAVDGPAPGAPAADVQGQLIAHWRSDSTSIEVRWPADLSTRVADQLGLTREDVRDQVADEVSPSSFVEEDLTIDRTVEPDGSVHAGATSYTTASNWATRPGADGAYRMAVVAYERTAATGQQPSELTATWGEGLCAAVQLTVRPAVGGADVLGDAERLYEALVVAGGPLQPRAEPEPLVLARVEADSLQPVSECNVPAGVDQDPVRSEEVNGGGPHPTADDALAAYLGTQTMTDEGPFGPIEWSTVATGGYTAISLPDGSVAFDLPDPPAPLPEVIGYYVAESVDGGWSITRYEGPSC